MAKAAAKKKPPTKTEILNNIAETTGLTKKQVGEVLEALTEEILCLKLKEIILLLLR